MIDSRPPTEAESELPAFVSKDLLYYKHGSSVVVVCLAPNHPALSKVKKVVFSSTHTQKTGTKSHRITKGEKICEIITEDDVHYTPRYEDTGVLLEVNRRLLNEPELINKSPTYEGYLVIFKCRENFGKYQEFKDLD